jgi:hypothetical protein
MVEAHNMYSVRAIFRGSRHEAMIERESTEATVSGTSSMSRAARRKNGTGRKTVEPELALPPDTQQAQQGVTKPVDCVE